MIPPPSLGMTIGAVGGGGIRALLPLSCADAVGYGAYSATFFQKLIVLRPLVICSINSVATVAMAGLGD